MLPGITGEAVLEEIRKKGNLPVIVLTAKDSLDEKVKVLTSGADDYITKPFKPSILYLKCLAMMKRDQKIEEMYLEFGHVKLDKMNHVLIIDGQSIILAHKEYELLLYLCNHHNQLLTRQQILDKIWGYDYYGDGRAVDTYIKKLRKKLGKYSVYIQTVIKTGYIFKVVNIDESIETNII